LFENKKDKKDLLVDVKIPQTSFENDDIAEDEYLKSFRFDNSTMRKKSNDIENDVLNSSSEIDEDEHEYEVHDDDDDDSLDDEVRDFANIVEEDEEDEIPIRDKPAQKPNATEENDEEKLLRNKLKNSFDKNTNNDFDGNDERLLTNIKKIGDGDKIKLKKGRTRPSLLDYYSTTESDNQATNIISSMLTSAATSVITNAAASAISKAISQQNEKDIDETFEFLNDEDIN
jgi:hypothetical protein